MVILVPRDENDTGQKENEGLALVSNLPGPCKPLLGIITTPFSTHPPNLSTTTEPKKKKTMLFKFNVKLTFKFNVQLNVLSGSMIK